MRKRFREGSGESLPDYELLKLVLFRAMPRRDTKLLAKAILTRFGSFAEAMIATAVALCELDLSVAHFKGLSLHIVFKLIPMLYDFGRAAHAEILQRVAEVVESGRPKPVLDERRYTLGEAGQAYARLESRKAIGKVIVEV
ncbi:zinc-binding dehydrogenase [Methyloceanibacter sp.]|uniref:zinc-binding dehydrogenase n=1 Tax=Methyloceanibacter sp. TaxID=1965321 RepID=UPI003C7169FA